MFEYASGVVPAGYRCAECGAHGCKLWRPAHREKPLYCCDCSARCQKIILDSIDAEGRTSYVAGGSQFNRGDQIWGYLPAVPTEDGENFWGYTSVPEAGVAWWRALPTRVIEVADG